MRKVKSKTVIVCVSQDLKGDVDLFASGRGYVKAKDFSKIKDNDVAILYTHGQYDTCSHGIYKADNTISWSDKDINAQTAAKNLKTKLALPCVKDLKLIVHACFSAGTVERSPKQANATGTFAGQLCSWLSPSIPGITVIGYQGATKAGRAGFPVDAGPETSRTLRGTDAHEGEKFEVSYTIGDNGVVISSAGSLVVWR